MSHHPSNYHTESVHTEQRINRDGSVTTYTTKEDAHAHGNTHYGHSTADHAAGHQSIGHHTSGQYQSTGHHAAGHQSTGHHTAGHQSTGHLTTSYGTTTRTVDGHRQVSAGGGRLLETRVVGFERGAERLISMTETVLNTEQHVLNERITHHHTRVPKKVVREEIVEKTIVVPEVIQIEEWIDEEVEVEDKVIEIAKIIQIEKVVEIPEIEIIERIIEVPEHVIREKIREVPRIEHVERIVEVPVVQTIEKLVEVPHIEYRDIPVEKIVEVPEIVTEEIPREVAIPQYVDRPIEQIQVVHDSYTVERKIPVPVEAETIVEYALPHIKPRYSKKKFPVYLPRFVEVPIARQFADAGMLAAADTYSARVANLTQVKPAVALSEIEILATEIKDSDLVNRHSLVTGHRTMKDLYAHAWETGNFEYFGGIHQGHHGHTTGVTHHSHTQYSTAVHH